MNSKHTAAAARIATEIAAARLVHEAAESAHADRMVVWFDATAAHRRWCPVCARTTLRMVAPCHAVATVAADPVAAHPAEIAARGW